MKRVDIDPYSKLLIIRFKFRKKDWKEDLETKKNMLKLYKKTYSDSLKAWIVPPDVNNITKLWDWGFSFPHNWAELAGHEVTVSKKIKLPYHHIKIPKGLEFLRPYQKECYQFLEYNNGRGLIGDDMGTGKTVEAIGWIKGNIRKGPALIIVPMITKPQWKRAFKKWVKRPAEILYGQTPYPLDPTISYILNWEIVHYWEKTLMKIPFFTLIADEAQNMGNSKSKRTKSTQKLARKIPSYVPMSGTPINSKTRQFFPILNCIAPHEFSNEWQFLNRYCVGESNGFGKNFNGASHTAELHSKISKYMIRRKKHEVLKDLPKAILSIVPMPIGKHLDKYRKLESAFFDTYETHSMSKLQIDNEAHNLKLQVFDMKLESILLWIDDFIKSEEKLIVGCWHKYVIETLFNKYKEISTMINGSVTGKKREQALYNFQNKKNCQLCFLQLKSGGVGLDGLQNVCHNAALVEFENTSTLIDQFIGRLERSGQKEPPNIFALAGEGTIEVDQMEILDEQRQNIDAVVDGKATPENNLLTILFNKRKKK